jgi:hypothetical protein
MLIVFLRHTAPHPQGFDRCRLVFAHQAAVTGDIGTENGGELAPVFVLCSEPPP